MSGLLQNSKYTAAFGNPLPERETVRNKDLDPVE